MDSGAASKFEVLDHPAVTVCEFADFVGEVVTFVFEGVLFIVGSGPGGSISTHSLSDILHIHIVSDFWRNSGIGRSLGVGFTVFRNGGGNGISAGGEGGGSVAGKLEWGGGSNGNGRTSVGTYFCRNIASCDAGGGGHEGGGNSDSGGLPSGATGWGDGKESIGSGVIRNSSICNSAGIVIAR